MKFVTKASILLGLSAFLGCAHLQYTNSAIVGLWSWDIQSDKENYHYYGTISLRRDGKMSSSGEMWANGTGLADDSFGEHSYGWFVKNDAVCFVTDERAWKERQVDDPELQCSWRIQTNRDGSSTVLMWDAVISQHVALTRIRR